MVELLEYVDLLGRNAFGRWFSKLDETVQARIVVSLDRMERGNLASAKGVGAGLLELRLDFGPGYRIYCGKDGERLVILLGGGTKKRQQADIEAAQELWHEYKKRKREETRTRERDGVDEDFQRDREGEAGKEPGVSPRTPARGRGRHGSGRR